MRRLGGALALLWAMPAAAATTRGAAFLRVPVDARAAALAEIGAVNSDGPAALFTNPAGLSRQQAPALSMGRVFYFENTRLDALAFHWPTLWGGLGVGTRWLTAPSIEQVVNDVPAGRFSSLERTAEIGASLGRNSLSVGAAGRLYQAVLAGRRTSAALFDLGILKSWAAGRYQFGAALQNFGSSFGFGGASGSAGDAPFQWRTGFSGRLLPGVTGMIERTFPSDARAETQVAFEFAPRDGLMLRTGYVHEGGGRHRDADFFSHMRMGFGLKLGSFLLDYAFSAKETLGAPHRVTLTKRFLGLAQPETSGRVTMEAMPAHFSPNDDGKNDRTFFLFGTEGVAPVVRWRVDLRSAQGLRIHRYEGPGASPGLLEWDGQDARGRGLPDGEYTLHGRAWSETHQAFSRAAAVVLDRRPPDIAIALSTFALTAENALEIRLRAKDRGGLDRWRLSVKRAADGREVFHAAGVFQSNAAQVTWAGLLSDGGLAPSGAYRLEAWADDAAGNTAAAAPVDVRVARTERPSVEPILARWDFEKVAGGYSLHVSTAQALGRDAVLSRDMARLALYWTAARVHIRAQNEADAWAFYRRLRGEGAGAKQLQVETGQARQGLTIRFLWPQDGPG